MQKKVLIVLFCLLTFQLFCQNDKNNKEYNFGFEKITNPSRLPDGWFKWGSDDYTLKTDTAVKHNGNQSLLIESKKTAARNSYGCVAYAIPANYLGGKIEVRAHMRFEDTFDSEIGLLLRIEDKNQKILEYENGRQKNVHGGSFWNYYSAALPFPPKAKTIYIGAVLTGVGKLWVDDFQVMIDGKPITEAKQKAKLEFKADRDDEFNEGSTISSIELTSEKTEALFVLGKVWGFLKYYHPAIAKGNYNWDYELFRVLPKLLACKNKTEKNLVLSAFIDELGEVKKDKEKIIDSSAVNCFPDLNWINDTLLLGSKLSQQLNQIKNAKRPDESYYIDLSKSSGEPEFKNENAYEKLNYPDAGFQLLSLYRYWNIIEYYYPYKKLLDKKWNDVLKESIPLFLKASNELEYKLAVLALIKNMDDPNANIMAPNPIVTSFKGNNRAPLDVSFIEDKAVVTGLPAKPGTEKIKLREGDIILKINGKNIEDVVKEKSVYTAAANPSGLLRNIAIDLLRTNDSIIDLTYQREGIVDSAVVKCYQRDALFKLKNEQGKDSSFKYYPQGILYINANNFKSSTIEKIMPVIFKAKGLIIDLRNSPSEFFVNSLGDYLLPTPKPFAVYSKNNFYTPGLFTFADKKMIGSENHVYYRGRVVILVNEFTQSSAEYHAMAFRMAPKSMIIGSTTAGSIGPLVEVRLPGGIHTMVAGVGIYYPDGKEAQRLGIIPDALVVPTIKGVSAHRDEQLERALEILSK